MQLVTALIKPFKLDDVRQALMDLGATGITITEVRGFGRQNGHGEIYRGAEYAVDFRPKIRLELIVIDELLERAVETVTRIACTGRIGDGKIFVTELRHVVRIRTGKTGPEAI